MEKLPGAISSREFFYALIRQQIVFFIKYLSLLGWFPCAKFAASILECDFHTKPLTARSVQFYGEEDMKMKQKLRQVCAELNISRRTIQGYEKEGLVSPSGKNKYGHLLYGEAERERSRLVRFYQQVGFPLKEIKALMEAPVPIRKAALERKEGELESECLRLQELIRQVKEYIAVL